jgi:hypothetical protein
MSTVEPPTTRIINFLRQVIRGLSLRTSSIFSACEPYAVRHAPPRCSIANLSISFHIHSNPAFQKNDK